MAAGELLKRRLARNRLIDFIQYTLPVYSNPAHQVLLAEKLEAVERGEIKRLMVFMPPRHLKSETCSIRFPAWFLGRNPQKQIIGCSYAESLAYTFSYAVRETISSPLYQKLWPLQLDTSGAVRWQLANKDNRRPSYIAAGIGGGITGEGADLLVIDDPVRDYAEAMSETYRDRAWQWWIATALTRLQPGGAVVLVMTRWHEDDLAGRILKVSQQDPGADQWVVVHFPAISGGNALWPEKYPLELLESIKAGQVDNPDTPGAGSRAFEALYQGNPTRAVGNIFRREWWQYYRERPVFNHIVHSWDTAFKSSSENDYSVCTSWGVTQSGYYLLDVWRQRVEFPELKRACKSLYERDHPWQVYIEDKASGQSLLQELKRDTAIPLKPVKIDSDKTARAYAVTPLIESGRVYLPERASWLHDFIEELSTFPNGEHDDCVDSLTQALGQIAGSGRRYAFEV